MIKSDSLSFTVLIAFVFTAFVSGCSDKDQATKSPLQGLGDTSGQFEKPSRENRITFPAAHAPHKTYQQEWWYLTANLKTEDGLSLATQWTLFRRAVEQKHWYFAHAALADHQQHYSAFRDGREELGNVVIKTQPFEASIDNWRWQSTDTFLPAQLNYGSFIGESNNQYELPQDKQGWQVNLQLSSDPMFFLQGDNGFSKKHHTLDIASHYYSQPFIKVTGKVYWQGEWRNVTGNAWLDREWGSQMLAQDQQGWDWFSLRLNENTALMVYRIRSDVQDYTYGSLMKSDGSIKILSADDIVIVEKESGNSAEHSSYPQRFSLAIAEEDINIEVNVINNKQVMRFGIEYFEGMVTFSGTHRGEGFLEMTGYEN